MLFGKILQKLATAASIFATVKTQFDEKQVPIENSVSCDNDEMASVLRRCEDFVARLGRV